MRKIVVSTYVTLDGVVEAPHTWHFRSNRDQVEANYVRDVLFESDALLMGRETYEVFAPVWSSRTAADDEPGSEGFNDRINSLPKYVASTTLEEPLQWNSTLIVGDVAQEVARLKALPGKNILMYGCGPVANLLMQHELVDELQLWVYPIVMGKGAHFFTDASTFPPLKLIDTKVFTSGIVVLTYKPGQVK
ncbi:MAG TPA: dihydrofolate reductase family protein [Phototrophicaceae bacterium]|jgi:dihydrofolate reductase|nr:dihydrofolate reductase family protein [Phototrophicaceae bacterium]